MTRQPDVLALLGLGGGVPSSAVARHATLYLVAAGLCLLLALRFLGSALAPIGPLLRAIAAAALVALAVGAALALLAVAVLGGGVS